MSAPISGMTGRSPRSGSAKSGPISQALQAPEILAAEPATCCLDADEAGICRFLVVGILGVVPAAVGVDDASESVLIRLSCSAFSGQGILRLFTRLPAFPAARP